MRPEAYRDALRRPAAKKSLDGGQRTATAEATLARMTPMMARAGITRLANITGLDNIGLPVVVAVRPGSRSVAISQGKGLTLEAARVSALMESLEGWHAERPTVNQRLESRRELLRSERVLELDRPHLKPAFPVNDDTQLVWAEGLDLIDGESCWAPLDLVTLNMVQAPGSALAFLRSSNGLASGNTLVEAMVHALCELIERDAVARWSRLDKAAVKETQIRLETLPQGPLRDVRARILDAGAIAALWDITSDLGVPAYAAQVVDGEVRRGFRLVGSFSGFGAHPNREVAALRALTEAVQSRLSIVSGSRDDLDYTEYERCRQPEAIEALLAEIACPVADRDFADTASIDSDDFRTDLATLLARMGERRGGPVIAFDLTRPDLGVPVVRMVAPELAHMPNWSEPVRRAAMEPAVAS